MDEHDMFAPNGRALPVLLSEWQDSDVAHYQLGSVLGLSPDTSFASAKAIVTTVNPRGTAIQRVADALVHAGILQFREDPDGPQYRWALAEESDVTSTLRIRDRDAPPPLGSIP